MNYKLREKGFGLVGLLSVVLIIMIFIASYLFFFDPIRKFKSARDAERWSDISLILNSIKNYQKKNGHLLESMKGMYPDEWYMIVSGSMTSGCDNNNSFSDVEIYDDDHCVNISQLVDDGYLGSVPVSPAGKIKWDSGINNSNKGTGYALMVGENGTIYVQSSESENIDQISMFR